MVGKAIAVVDKAAPKGWRLKLAKASAQLLVGTRAGAAVYAEAREHLDEIEARSAMNKQLYAVAAQQIISDPEMVERAKARLVSGMLRKQENLEAVIAGAGDKMLALPAPTEGDLTSSVEQSDEEVDRSAGDQPRDVPGDPLNSDWAAAFSEVAENATSEELRDRLARMLVGEISSTGTFPRSTIRAIAELEQADLQTFVEVLPFTYGSGIVGETGIGADKLDALHACGLIEYNSAFGRVITINASPETAGGLIGKDWAIAIHVSEAKSISLPIIPLTRVGKAVITLLDQFDEEAALEAVVERLDKSGINQVQIGKYNASNDGKYTLSQGRIVFPKSSMRFLTPGLYGGNLTGWRY